MPSNKKKRKPANSSARGFATTSTPSKPKLDGSKEETGVKPTSESGQCVVNNAEPINTTHHSAAAGNPQKELHELTPEELESHLENSNLQRLLEEYGEKCKKDALRQVNRLTTEQRFLRPQCEQLDRGTWLPDELVQEILDRLNVHTNNINIDTERFKAPSDSEASESDLLIRLWTLQKILGQLGFKEAPIRFVLGSLVKKWQGARFGVAKDSIWGLDDCFDLLTSTCDPKDLPPYDFQSTNGRTKGKKAFQHGKRNEGHGQQSRSPIGITVSLLHTSTRQAAPQNVLSSQLDRPNQYDQIILNLNPSQVPEKSRQLLIAEAK
jgi:ATP-dependent RNA helicase DHX29